MSKNLTVEKRFNATKIIVLDNYDSFTFNLVHYLSDTANTIKVFRNDDVEDSAVLSCSHLVLSPGPGLPKNAGEMPRIIKNFHAQKKILGICLGMQGLGEFFGGKLINLSEVKHGKQETIHINQSDPIFKGIPPTFQAGLYHSWALDKKHWPKDLILLAETSSEIPMAFKHNKLPIYGLQFHPESIMTPFGKKILDNWLKI